MHLRRCGGKAMTEHGLTVGQKVIKYTAMTLAVLVIAGIASGIAGLIELIFGGGDVGEMRRYEISDNVTDLEMEIGGSAFSLVYADGFAVESNIKDLRVSARGGKLFLKEGSKVSKNRTDAVIVLYVPKDFVFDNAKIETGAGDFSLPSLSAKRLSLSLGAGKVEIGELNVKDSAKIEGGAGAFSINGGSIHALEFEMGMGDVKIRAEMLGNCELNFGVGKAELTLLGTPNDYRLDIEKGLGEIKVDGAKYESSTMLGTGNTSLEIECGIGKVNIDFAPRSQN